MTDAPAPPDENSVPGLWETARYFFRWLVSICGDPCTLVREGWLSRKERRDVLHWLRPVEAVVRRLLVAEAAAIASTLPPARAAAFQKAGRPARPPFCRVSFPDPENPAGWTVRFSVYEPDMRKPTARHDRSGPRVHVLDTDSHVNVLASAALARSIARHRERFAPAPAILEQGTGQRPKPSRAAGSPWRLARRIEALARVLENPGVYARRLAKCLRNHAGRLAECCRPPPAREPGQRPRYGEESIRRASEHALQALVPFDTG